jgi:hypothetical protein
MLLLFSGVWGTAGCLTDDEAEGTGGETAEAAERIANGTADTTEDAEFPASIRIADQGCSGTLITPRWVITAQHCYDDPGDLQVNDNIQAGAQQETFFPHTYVTSGEIKVWESAGLEHRENDLALVRLDEPAKGPWARPAHPPLTAGGCGSTFQGQLVGYAGTGYNENGYNCVLAPSGTRRFGAIVTWENVGSIDPGSTFRHDFVSPPGQGCTAMAGIGIGGDSGGSLYRTADKALCGVISGDGYWACSGSASTTLTCNYHTVALDDQEAIEFWSEHVLDETGWWEGECEAVVPCPGPGCNDPDGDQVPSSCDSCPDFWNPEQLTEFDDDDSDGVGNACDLCPSHQADLDTQEANRNFEIEFALAYPTHNTPPVLKRSDYGSPALWDAAKAQYIAAFEPDVCDPQPVPVFERPEGGDLPAGSYYTSNPISDTCVAYTQGCAAYVDNKIELAPESSTKIDQLGGGTVTVGLRWCDCKDAPGFDPTTMAGRTACRKYASAKCSFNESFYTPSTLHNWKPITTKHDTQGWAAPELGKQWTLAAGSAVKTVTWNFDALGSTHVVDSENLTRVNGMLWSHVDNSSLVGQPGFPSLTNLRKYANTLGSGYASAGLKPQGHLWVAVDHWLECLGCPYELKQVFFEPGLYDFHETNSGGSGKNELGVSDPPSRQHYDEVGQGARKQVSASEPLARLKVVHPAGETVVRGAALSNAGQLLGTLRSTQLDRLPQFFAASATGGPTLVGQSGFAFSATKQRLYVLGGLTALGGPKNDGWWLDLEGTPTWRQFVMPTGETVGAVLAMVYRYEDEAIYFLDKSGTTLRLRRWNTQRKLSQGKLQTLATFPAAWGTFPKYALVAGSRGELGIVGYGGSGTEKTRFGRIAVTAASRVSLVGLTKSAVEIPAQPALTTVGFAYTTNRFQGALLRFASMPAPAAADLPTIVPH